MSVICNCGVFQWMPVYDSDNGHAPRSYLLEFIETSLEISIMYIMMYMVMSDQFTYLFVSHFPQFLRKKFALVRLGLFL